MIAVMLLLGAGMGGGIVLVVRALRPGPELPSAPEKRARLFPDLPARLARAAAAAVVAGLLTRWPVAIAAGGAFGFYANDLLSARSQRERDVDRSEAIAAWVEMLRDTITAVSGLEEAIVATAGLAPTQIRPAIEAGGAFGFFASDLLSARSQRERDVDRSEAIAAWVEMLRDTITAVSGLEEAIVATAGLAPTQIRPAIEDLVIRLERQSLSASLAELAEDLGDPTADLVIAALALAARGEAKELGELLSSLAETSRDNASMRVRVDAVRARTRTAVRIISTVTVGMMALLLLLNRTYLQPFDSAVGQVTLVVIFAGFATGLTWLSAMSRYQAPERFIVAVGLEEATG